MFFYRHREFICNAHINFHRFHANRSEGCIIRGYCYRNGLSLFIFMGILRMIFKLKLVTQWVCAGVCVWHLNPWFDVFPCLTMVCVSQNKDNIKSGMDRAGTNRAHCPGSQAAEKFQAKVMRDGVMVILGRTAQTQISSDQQNFRNTHLGKWKNFVMKTKYDIEVRHL